MLLRIWYDHKDNDERKLFEEIDRRDKMELVDLEDDIYCIGFIIFLRYEDNNVKDRVVMKAFIAFIFQVVLVLLMIKQFIALDLSGGDIESQSILMQVKVGKPSVNMARLVCGFLLHVMLLQEVSSALSMLDFIKRNPMQFVEQRFEYPAMFATCKLIGGMICVFANCMVMLTDDTIENVIKDFIAVGIIATIDDLMAGTVKNDFDID